jgi:hypothetical protein
MSEPVQTPDNLVAAIGAALRAGAISYSCDTDGYHDAVAFREGHFLHANGFRASSNPPTRLDDEAAAIALVRKLHPQRAGATEVESLQAILDALVPVAPPWT